jgi:hypothetical protein
MAQKRNEIYQVNAMDLTWQFSPRPQVRPAITSDFDFALRPSAKKIMQAHTLLKLHAVIQFFCLDLGCQHVWGEISLSTGSLDSIQATGMCTSCPICNRTYHKDFLPIFHCSVISFFGVVDSDSKTPVHN